MGRVGKGAVGEGEVQSGAVWCQSGGKDEMHSFLPPPDTDPFRGQLSLCAALALPHMYLVTCAILSHLYDATPTLSSSRVLVYIYCKALKDHLASLPRLRAQDSCDGRVIGQQARRITGLPPLGCRIAARCWKSAAIYSGKALIIPMRVSRFRSAKIRLCRIHTGERM